MFTSGMRRLSQLGTVVGGGVVSNSVLDGVLNESAGHARSVDHSSVLRNRQYLLDLDHESHSSRVGEISESECSAAMDTLTQRPDILLDVLPPELVRSHPIDALKLVQSVMGRADVVALARHNLAKHNKKVMASEDLKLTASPTEVNPSHMWQQLYDKFPCVLCQDVLAAPTLMDCGHSLCGCCSEVCWELSSCILFGFDFFLFCTFRNS